MGPMKKYVLLLFLLFLGINQGAYFKHIEKNETSIYDRQYRIGYGPESFMLDETMNVLETTIKEN